MTAGTFRIDARLTLGRMRTFLQESNATGASVLPPLQLSISVNQKYPADLIEVSPRFTNLSGHPIYAFYLGGAFFALRMEEAGILHEKTRQVTVCLAGRFKRMGTLDRLKQA